MYEISCDDGHPLDFKLIELLKKYDLNCTFYIPSSVTKLTKSEIKKISENYEIGGHTMTHALLTRVDPLVARDEVFYGKKALESITGCEINSFCYPRGYYSKEIKEIVKNAGFKEARTTRLFNTIKSDDPFEKHTTIHAFQNPLYGEDHWVEVALKYLETKPDYFHLWLHSWEVERDKQWANLEIVLRRIYENIHSESK